MTAPQKPWESQHYKSNPIINQGDVPQSSRLVHQHVNVLNSNAPPLSTQPAGPMRPLMLPSLPPRPPHLTTSSLRPMGMAPTMYGGYAGGYTGGYNSGYGGGYGNYPGSMYMPGVYNYGSYGNFGNGFQNRFLQVAEEGSRNAFQSIASIVHAFTSVSMMLESTYHAMYSSFQAILGVVDNFSRLRLVFTQLLSAITILRTIRNFYWKLLYWLGILKNKPQAENVWRTAGLPVDPNNQVVKYSSWPLITFFGLLFGGPYLISKFFSAKPKDWDNERGTTVRAAYPHQAASEAELSFNAQDVLNLAPPELQDNNTGWMLARNCQGRVGYVPVTRLNVIPARLSRKGAVVNNIPNNQDVNTST